jgi:hypothetical protein
MGTKDVRIDTRLNKAIWAQGVRGTPFRHFYASGIKLTSVQSSRSEHWERQVKDMVSFFLLLHCRINTGSVRKWRFSNTEL